MSKWVPESERDTSYYIFNEKFHCTVPHIDMRSNEHIRMFGMPSSGIRELDKEIANERIQTFLSIGQMCEYFKRGAVVGIKKESDTKIIYERISDHLNAWLEKLRHGLNNGDAPIDDLKLMDQFANSVYAHAKYQFTNDIVESILLRKMDSIMPFNRDMLIASMEKNARRADERSGTNTATGNAVSEPEPPQRESLSDFFSTYSGRSTLTPNRWEK